MKKAIRPCMGGWCARRESCPNYHSPHQWLKPAERLCGPVDGILRQPVRPVRIPTA